MVEEDEWPDVDHGPGLRRDLGNEQLQFEKSMKAGRPNYGYVAIAIGGWASRSSFPAGAPEWALDACRTLREKAELSTRLIVGTSRGPGGVPSDGERLELMADLLVDPFIRKAYGLRPRPSIHSLLLVVLDDTSLQADDPNVRRLRSLWLRDSHHRKARAAARLHRKLRRAGWVK